MTLSRLSAVSFLAVTVSPSHYVTGQGNATVQSYATTISTAQDCVKQCGVPASTDGTTNKLLECFDAHGGDHALFGESMESCCGMTADGMFPSCANSLTDAQTLLTNQLSDVKIAASDYFGCIYDNRLNTDTGCAFAGMCVSMLTGGYGTGLFHDFDVGNSTTTTTANNLAQMARTATSCDSMNTFGYNACDAVKGCCTTCAPRIANVVHAVTNNLLLPAYSDTVQNCQSKTCTEYGVNMPSPEDPPSRRRRHQRRRHMEGDTVIATTDVEEGEQQQDAEAGVLAEECTTSLINNIVQYNETYASENFFECVFKKMGKIAAYADSQKMTESGSGSGSSSSAFSTSTSAIVVATSLVLSAATIGAEMIVA